MSTTEPTNTSVILATSHPLGLISWPSRSLLYPFPGRRWLEWKKIYFQLLHCVKSLVHRKVSSIVVVVVVFVIFVTSSSASPVDPTMISFYLETFSFCNNVLYECYRQGCRCYPCHVTTGTSAALQNGNFSSFPSSAPKNNQHQRNCKILFTPANWPDIRTECTTRNVAQRVHLYRSGRRLRQQIGNFIKVIRCFVLRRQKEFRWDKRWIPFLFRFFASFSIHLVFCYFLAFFVGEWSHFKMLGKQCYARVDSRQCWRWGWTTR